MGLFMLAGMLILRVLDYRIGAAALFKARMRGFKRLAGGIAVFFLVLLFYVLLQPARAMLYMETGAIILFCTCLDGTVCQRVVMALKSVWIVSCTGEAVSIVFKMIVSQYLNVKPDCNGNYGAGIGSNHFKYRLCCTLCE